MQADLRIETVSVMIKICYTFQELNTPALLEIYSESIERRRLSEGISRFQAEDEFVDYLKDDFFMAKGSFYAVLIMDQVPVCALRAEPWCDGLLLSGLETRPDSRGNGFATQLLQMTLAHIKETPAYVHVHKKNAKSLAVHKKCGFEITKDFARLLDGAVSGQYYTLVKM